MKILFLHPAAAFGGASKSLIELWAGIQKANTSIDGTVICPRGQSANAFQKAGLNTIELLGLPQWDDSRFGYYRGLRWLILLRELALWPHILLVLWRLRNQRFELIHANEQTLLFPALIAKRWLKTPLVMHIRSLQRSRQGDFRTRWINALVARHAEAVVAIDETVRATLPPELSVEVIHNSMKVTFPLREVSTIDFPHRPRVAIIGVLYKAKGVYEFIEAARLCRDRGLDVEFLVVGENIRSVRGLKGWVLRSLHFAWDVRAELEALVDLYNLRDRVSFTGFVENVQPILRNLDILCFPSHLNAAGRPVFEAAFYGIPSIVAAKNPTPDTIVHGETGLCISEPDPEKLADALEHLLRNPEECQRLGKNARCLAQNNFDPDLNAARMLLIYERLTDASGS